MIEFKRNGDVMIFDCPAFKIEVVNGSEKITLSDSEENRITQIQDAFKVLDMMLEHKAKHGGSKKVTEMNFKVNVDITDAGQAIDALNKRCRIIEKVEASPGHRFREFMKREGL